MIILTPPSPQNQPTQYVNDMDQRREKCHTLLLVNQLNLPHLFTCGLFKAPAWSSHFSWLCATLQRCSLDFFPVSNLPVQVTCSLFQAFSFSLSVPVCLSSSLRIINLWDYFLGFFLNTRFFDDQRFVNKIQSSVKFSLVTENSSSVVFVHQNNNLNQKYWVIFHHPWSSW